jgi:Phage tail tube protein
MATTGVVNSKLMRLKFGGTYITCQTNADLKVTNGTRQTTCKDSGQWEEFLYGQSNWTMSGDLNFSYDAAQGGTAIYDVTVGQTLATLVYGTGVTGDVHWSGSAVITEWSLSSPGQNENVTCAYSFQGTGALVKLTL